jgi:hypothetical protein
MWEEGNRWNIAAMSGVALEAEGWNASSRRPWPSISISPIFVDHNNSMLGQANT